MEKEIKIEGLCDLSLKDISLFYEISTGKKIPDSFSSLSEGEQKKWIRDFVRTQHPNLRDSLTDILVGMFYAGDRGRPTDQLPDWLDIERYKRGQAVIRRYLYGISLNNVVSTSLGFTFLDGLKYLVTTRKSSTPYTSYRRYITTVTMMQNWYFNDPFAKGSSAFNDVQYARKMHLNVRKKWLTTSTDTLKRDSVIENGWTPAFESLMKDFQEVCPERNPEQCPFALFDKEFLDSRKAMSQADMVIGQFAFTGLVILYPKDFGMANITDQELGDYIYVWRCLGYLLGIDDDFNICRGTLQEVQQRATDFVEIWLKPTLPQCRQEWEHMMRCMFEGMSYYLPLPSFDVVMYHCFKMMNVETRRFKERIRLIDWIHYKSLMFLWSVSGRISGVAYILNQTLLACLRYGNNFSKSKHKALVQMSSNVWKFPTQQLQS